MQTKWNAATQKYTAAKKAKQKEIEENLTAMAVRAALKPKLGPTDVQLGAYELQEFMVNEGHSAMELLKASGRHIILGEDYDGGGYGQVYIMNSDGFRVSTEAMGMWVAYSKNVAPPVLTPITPEQTILAAVRQGRLKPREVVDWLRQQLDKIADVALAQK